MNYIHYTIRIFHPMDIPLNWDRSIAFRDHLRRKTFAVRIVSWTYQKKRGMMCTFPRNTENMG